MRRVLHSNDIIIVIPYVPVFTPALRHVFRGALIARRSIVTYDRKRTCTRVFAKSVRGEGKKNKWKWKIQRKNDSDWTLCKHAQRMHYSDTDCPQAVRRETAREISACPRFGIFNGFNLFKFFM